MLVEDFLRAKRGPRVKDTHAWYKIEQTFALSEACKLIFFFFCWLDSDFFREC